jgi:hypothetical protein
VGYYDNVEAFLWDGNFPGVDVNGLVMELWGAPVPHQVDILSANRGRVRIYYNPQGNVPSRQTELKVHYRGRCGEAQVHCKISFSAPRILVAGYWDTRMTASGGGTLTLLAVTQDVADGTGRVEVCYGGAPTGIALNPSGSDVWGLTLPLDPPLSPASLALELVGEELGVTSAMWPYLTVR